MFGPYITYIASILNAHIVGRICNIFKKNRAFYDKSMKLCTCLVDINSN